MEYTRVKVSEIHIFVENDRILVWGSFHEKGKRYRMVKRYFDNVEEAMEYYNKQLDKVMKSIQ